MRTWLLGISYLGTVCAMDHAPEDLRIRILLNCNPCHETPPILAKIHEGHGSICIFPGCFQEIRAGSTEIMLTIMKPELPFDTQTWELVLRQPTRDNCIILVSELQDLLMEQIQCYTNQLSAHEPMFTFSIPDDRLTAVPIAHAWCSLSVQATLLKPCIKKTVLTPFLVAYTHTPIAPTNAISFNPFKEFKLHAPSEHE